MLTKDQTRKLFISNMKALLKESCVIKDIVSASIALIFNDRKHWYSRSQRMVVNFNKKTKKG